MENYVFIITEKPDILVLDISKQNSKSIFFILLAEDFRVYSGLIEKSVIRHRLLNRKWRILGKKEAKKLYKLIHGSFSKLCAVG